METTAKRTLLMVTALGVWSWWVVATALHAQTFTEVGISAGVSSSGPGAVWGDYDGDGDLDLYVVANGPNALYLNNSDGTFTNIALSAGVDDPGRGPAVATADYDNDGDLDIALFNGTTVDGVEGVNRLYQNKGDGKFTEVGVSAGVSANGNRGTGAWGDYNNDGSIDLYVGDGGGLGSLYHNKGNGTFMEVGAEVGLGDINHGRIPVWGDYDNDGDLDLYVTLSLGGNWLYQNNGDGRFTSVATSAGVDDASGAGAGAAWGDYDSDGDLDLYVTNVSLANRLYRNEGNGKFTEVAESAGVNHEDGHGAAWGDYDNDGDLDLYVVVSAGNRLYQNNSDGTFKDVAAILEVNYDAPALASAATWGDYDNDGDLDLYVGNGTHPDNRNLLYRNEGTPNRWLQVKLQGMVSNRSAIGTRVTGVAGDKRQMWEVEGGAGFCSQNSLPVEFGFGQTTTVDSLIIRWPSGIVQTFTNLETNQRLAIVESNPLITAVEEETATLPSTFSLSQNYPNPFNPQTTIHYEIPEEAEVRLGIFNLAGQQVRTLAAGSHQPGQYRAVWDGMDASGRVVASGVYLYQLEVVRRGITETKRMALVR